VTSPSTESERNRLLRRADWRYLLPDPSPRRALCVSAALAASCAAVATSVDDAPQPDVAYDLVVAEDPDDATLRTLAGCARPGGVCYVEWRRVVPGGLGRLRRRLQRAGFRLPRCYHPWPSLAGCRAWVPTASPARDHYWRGAVRGSRVRRERLRDAAGWGLARLGVHGRVAAVALGPAGTAVGAPGTAEPALARIARQHGVSLAQADDGADAGRLLLLTPGSRSVGKVVALMFNAGGAPVAAVKSARVPAAAAGLLREAELLERVEALQPGGVAGVPRVLFRAELRSQPVIGQTALTGTPLAAVIHRRTYRALAERVTGWLTTLARPGGHGTHEPAWDRLVAPALDRFAAEYAPVLDDVMLRDTRDLLRSLGPLPVVCEQRDFSPWNVFDGPSGLVVLDWESGELRGLPALDLVYFFTHAAYYVESAWVSGRFAAAYREAWARDTFLGGVHRACSTAYLTSLGLDVRVLRPLRLLTWVLHAHSEYLHFRADAGAPPSAAQLRQSTFLALWAEELRGAAE